MKNKIINAVFAILFVLSAYVQLNDPDPWVWVVFYLFLAVVSGFAFFGKYNRWVLISGLVACAVGLIFLIPDFINWLQQGAPSITSSMKAEEPHIELTREFLGIFIGALVLLYQYSCVRKLKSPTP